MTVDRQKTGWYQRIEAFCMNRMVPAASPDSDSLLFWRIRILFAIVFLSLLIGTFVMVPVIALGVKERLWGLLALDGAAWATGLLILLNRHLGYRLRAAVVLVTFYALGVMIIAAVGPVSGGPAWLFAFPVMAGLLFGARVAALALAVNAATLVALGILIHQGTAHGTSPVFSSVELMISTGANFMLLNTIASISVAVLVRGLISSHQKESHLMQALKAERRQLLEAKSALELEIEERRAAEDALRKSEETYREFVEGTDNFVAQVDADGRLTYVNPTAEKVFGLDKDRCMGRSAFDFVHPDDRTRTQKAFQEWIEKRISSTTFENRQVNQVSGKVHHLQWTINVHYHPDHGITGINSIAQDISDRIRAEAEKRRLQDQLMTARRMEAIASLAGGIAHQFNNALTPISLGIDLLDEPSAAHDENTEEGIAAMRDSVQRIARLTRQLLAYARGGRYQPVTIAVGRFVDDTLPLLKHAINPAIRVDTDLPPGLPHMNVDLTQMQMVLSAILANASEAINGNGHIRIACRKYTLTADAGARSPVLAPGDYIRLSVQDNGAGMEAAVRERIFEPFFSTKFQGRGLGMAAAYGIVKNHGGWISVDSVPGRGTTAAVYLPAVAGSADPEPEADAEPARGRGTILLVEDETAVMQMSRRLFEKLGYRVLPAPDGRTAVEIARHYGDLIDAVFLDILLPDMTGTAVFHHLKALRPEFKVVVCSGYSIDGPAREMIENGAQGFIQKPFSMADVSAALKQIFPA